MFAVVKTGGKQYKVAKNDVIKVEKLSSGKDSSVGEVVLLDEVLAFNDGKKTTIGAPVVKGVSVAVEVIEQKKDDKVLVFKKKRRHNYRRKVGHRQEVVYLRVQDIGEGLKAKSAPATKSEAKPVAKKATPKAETKKPVAKEAAKKPAAKKPAAKKTDK